MEWEKVWMITAKIFVRGDVERIVRELESKGFRVEKKEIVFEYE